MPTVKRIGSTVAVCAVAAAAVIVAVAGGPGPAALAKGSGASATTTSYVQPVVPGMTLETTTVDEPVTSLPTAAPMEQTSDASPTLKATPAPGCVNNGQCP